MNKNANVLQPQDSILKVSRIGPKKADLFAKMGIKTLADALLVYPRDYEDHTSPQKIADLQAGEKACVRAVVGTAPQFRRVRRGMDITKLTVFDETGTLQITYFNNRFAAQALSEGAEYLFCGRVQQEGKRFIMLSPTSEQIFSENEQGALRYLPIYPLTAGITQKDLIRVTDAALTTLNGLEEDFLPEMLCGKYDLPEAAQALRMIHRPANHSDVERARRRMVFEELFLLCCGLQKLRLSRKAQAGIRISAVDPDAFWDALPFRPTSAQRRVADEIIQDVQSGAAMNRLVQGDVGSGKTVLAAFLCFLAANAGMQAAIMAPTEVLAQQHYKSLAPMFESFGFRTELLVGSLTKKEKQMLKARIAAGMTDIVIGTHALIQDDVEFKSLGAVVADEQHRFGVAQRSKLRGTGTPPHVLVMSATPIPRTLALILYGDLDVSVIDELPPGRLPIESYAVGEKMRNRIHAFIEKQLEAGGQVYVVCPTVEDGELPLKSAEEHGAALQKLLKHRRIGILHGRMRASEKEAVMRAFSAHELDVLVATTVIEVGVDVPNANLMVIEDADRFGLSQLHQLRGRVGRGSRQSYCVCFGADKGELAKQRLKIFTATTDGFEIAKADLSLRGPGDFFGTRQHGLPALHAANIASDLLLMQNAREEAERLLEKDPELDEYPRLRERIDKMFSDSADAVYN